jgi:hypothetical protein
MAAEKPPSQIAGLPLAQQSTPQHWQPAVPELLKAFWLLPVIGAALYTLLRVVYSRFYWKLGLQPEDVGLGYAQILDQSLVALVLLTAFSSVAITLLVLIPDSWFQPKFARRWFTLLSVIIPGEFGLILFLLWPSNPPSLVRGFLPLIFFISFIVYGIWLRLIRATHAVPARPELRAQRTVEIRIAIAWIVATLGPLLSLSLIAQVKAMDEIAADVRNGKTAHYLLFDPPVLAIGGDPATVYWPATPLPPSSPSPQTPAPYQHCLMYIGQANGSTVLYDVKSKTAIRVPSNTIIVQTDPEWKGSNCRP